MKKIELKDVPKGSAKITLRPEWQYRINGGYTQVCFFDKKGKELNEITMSGSGSSYRKLAYDGILVSDLIKKIFAAETLRILKAYGIEFFGDEEGEFLVPEDEMIFAIENSDS